MLKFDIDRGADIPMQEQIRRQVVDGIELGLLPEGMKLPSSRKLGAALGVSRNTAAGAYDRLVADGYLVSRLRSGLYVGRAGDAEPTAPRISGPAPRSDAKKWEARLALRGHPEEALMPDWERYPFPFIDGPFDQSLFPIAEWREASRGAMALSEVAAWSRDAGDSDDPELIEELRKKVLPRRGISARAEDILITTGAQQGLHLICEALVGRRSVVGLESPCSPDLRRLLRAKGAKLEFFDVDEHGLSIDETRLAKCDILFVSPSRQRPTGVAMPTGRRARLLDIAEKHGLVIVEDDYQWEAGFAFSDTLALRGEPGGGEVIYVASLAQPLAAAVRLGVLIAPAPVIRAARTARRITARSPALTLQSTFAQMLSLGLYTKALRRVETAFARRMTALQDALNHYLPRTVSFIAPRLGAAAWITGPDDLDVARFVKQAEAYGALLEPVSRYYPENAPANVFRLGVSGIEEASIRDGVARVAQALRDSMGGGAVSAQPHLTPLGHSALVAACTGATLLCKTVYEEPCTIHLNVDGTMTGSAGFASEDRDTGQWWVEEDFWCRQWTSWAYGEVGRFRVAITGDRMHWLNAEGRLIDWGIIAR
ncbi:MAG: PLP-dependent aminotransferase family protein [Pseudomonadota bacterium]